MNKMIFSLKNRILFRNIIYLGLPMLLVAAIHPIVNLIDSKMMAVFDDSRWQAGLAIASNQYMQLIFLFAFLMQSTLALVSRALGEKDHKKEKEILLRNFAFALLGSLIIWLLHPVIFHLVFLFIDPPLEVKEAALIYLEIRIYFIFIPLLNFIASAWLLANGRTKMILIYDLTFAILTIFFNLLFVLYFGWEIKGVAWGTVVAEIVAFILIIFVLSRSLSFSEIFEKSFIKQSFQRSKLLEIFSINKDAFLRTLCLLFILMYFNKLSAQFQDKDIIAANGVLMLLIMLIAITIEAFTHVSSSFIGRALGKNNMALLHYIAKILMKISLVLTFMASMIFFIFSDLIFAFLSSNYQVFELLVQYKLWLVIFPLILIIAFVYDGIFIGLGDMQSARNAAFFGCLSFLFFSFIFIPILNIHGLWLAFLSSFIVRSAYLFFTYQRKWIL